MSERIQVWFENGLPELGIPPQSWVFWWPWEGRYTYVVERGYDHGVILNQIESGNGEVTSLPSPGVLDQFRAAVAAGSQPRDPRSVPGGQLPYLRLLP